MQKAWDSYGENAFDFSILEEVSIEYDLVICEQKWYEYFKSYDNTLGYNLSEIARSGSCFATEQLLVNGKYKISKDQFDNVIYYLSNTDIPIPKVSTITKVSQRSIYQIYYHCIYSELTKDIVFIQRDKLSDQREGCKLSDKDVCEIINLLLNGKRRDSVANLYHVSNTTIDDIYFHRTWTKLTNEISFPPTWRSELKFPTKPLIQYDLNMNYISEYDSAREAEKATGITYKLISKVCRGERKYTHGFIFKFKEIEVA